MLGGTGLGAGLGFQAETLWQRAEGVQYSICDFHHLRPLWIFVEGPWLGIAEPSAYMCVFLHFPLLGAQGWVPSIPLLPSVSVMPYLSLQPTQHLGSVSKGFSRPLEGQHYHPREESKAAR